MMNKFAIVFLTAAMTLGSGAAMAAGGNNGTANQAADAGAAAGGAKENLAPNKVDNSKINNTGDATATHNGTKHKTTKHHSKMTADQIDKNTQCKDGKCPDINKKVGPGADTKTDGTTQ
ncbi:protein YbgS [Pantoea sp. MBD-2R]|uniref:protein YbgS n=1 Tax=unclassified Pantoea TaxID=2630326 RepID=UPI0011BE7226|nr:protein YbgS [Pantoea sp. CCBC3-3-1]